MKETPRKNEFKVSTSNDFTLKVFDLSDIPDEISTQSTNIMPYSAAPIESTVSLQSSKTPTFRRISRYLSFKQNYLFISNYFENFNSQRFANLTRPTSQLLRQRYFRDILRPSITSHYSGYPPSTQSTFIYLHIEICVCECCDPSSKFPQGHFILLPAKIAC